MVLPSSRTPAYKSVMVKKLLGLIVLCLVVAGFVSIARQSRLTRMLESGQTTSPDHSAPASGTTSSVRTVTSPPQAVVAPPSTDTIPPNPPNGLVFSGSGPFQLYRQGNLTWRVDTGSGKSCILFATDTEWRKSRVYQQGCAAS